MKHILLVNNFDANQLMAVGRAVLLAKQNNTRLTVFSVVKTLPSDERMVITIMSSQKLLDLVIHDCQEKINVLAADMDQQGVDTRSQLVIASTFQGIIRQVLRDKHARVILAAEERGGAKEWLFSNTSTELRCKCLCPVWVVKPAKRAKYKRILVAIDTASDYPDPERKSLNPLIMQLAGSPEQMDNSEFHIAQVWSVAVEEYMSARGLLGERVTKKLLKDIKREYTRKLDGLLVMGSVYRTAVAGFFIGNTEEKVLSEVNCSVLTVRPEGFAH